MGKSSLVLGILSLIMLHKGTVLASPTLNELGRNATLLVEDATLLLGETNDNELTTIYKSKPLSFPKGNYSSTEVMNSEAAVKYIKKIQEAFYVIEDLQINAYQWPDQAIVENESFYDFIVVGAGTAGSVIAAKLAADEKTSVLLIEAGGNPPLQCNIPSLMVYLGKSDVDWNYRAESDDNIKQCHASPLVDLMLGKMLGGTSGLNFLLVSEGSYKDYDYWAEVTNDASWKYEEVLPYFQKASDVDHNSEDADIEDNDVYINAFEETGNALVQSINGNESVGCTKSTFGIADGNRKNTAYTYLKAIKEYPNLHVLKNTVAKKILFDNHKNAIGVEVVTEKGVKMIFRINKEVIISAGTINSPKLLMLSGIGPKDHLESKGIDVVSDLPVGKNFQDHVAVIIVHNMTKLECSTKTRDSRKYPAENVVTTYVNLDKTEDYPEYSSVNYANKARNLVQFCAVTYGLRSEICDAMFSFSNTNPMLFSVVTILQPKSRGEVLLQSADYKDSPIVRTGYYSDEEDLENQVKYIEDFIRVTKTSHFQEAGGTLVDPKIASCADEEFATTDYWRCYAKCMMTTRRHYAGTNAMGSVVDGNLKVNTVNNLRVVDASIMPVITRGETNNPTIMIAKKAADIIITDYNLK